MIILVMRELFVTHQLIVHETALVAESIISSTVTSLEMYAREGGRK